jgi:hypothetical protein
LVVICSYSRLITDGVGALVPEAIPDRGQGGEEPDGVRPLPADGTGPDDYPGQPEEAGQGLFVCLPAEHLTLSGFAQGGAADTMAPGPLLAAVMHAVAGEDGSGLAALSDDQLMGVISATRRMECRIAWTQLAAIRELATRRSADAPDGSSADGSGEAAVSEFAADELADELHLSWQSAAGQITYACSVARRLPRSFAAMAAGRLHPVHLRIIEDETGVLSAEDAARADELLAGMAGCKTFGQLRSAARRLVLKLDPDAARRRREAAKRDAHVRRFREDSGNAGMVARELPPDEVLASWQHVEQRALDLRAAGVPGTLQELRVRAYLDLLQERDSRGTQGDQHSKSADDPGAGCDGQDETGGPLSPIDPPGPGDPPGPAGPRPPDTGPSIAALVNITVPLSAILGQSATPGRRRGVRAAGRR